MKLEKERHPRYSDKQLEAEVRRSSLLTCLPSFPLSVPFAGGLNCFRLLTRFAEEGFQHPFYNPEKNKEKKSSPKKGSNPFPSKRGAIHQRSLFEHKMGNLNLWTKRSGWWGHFGWAKWKKTWTRSIETVSHGRTDIVNNKQKHNASPGWIW